MTHSVLLCTSFRAHRINNCCAHHPRSCVLGRHCVWWCDFIFQKIWVCSHHGEIKAERAPAGWGEETKEPQVSAPSDWQKKLNQDFTQLFFFFLREVTSKIFPLWYQNECPGPTFPQKKCSGLKTAFFVFVLGSADGEMRYTALFLALNFNLGWLFQPYLIS